MPNATIPFPSRTTTENLMAFAIELDRYTEHDRLIIDMPDRVFVGPFGMLLVASKLRYLKQIRPRLQLIFNNWESYSYLSHMDFFSLCGFDHGNEVGQAPGNSRYLPITRLRSEELLETETDKFEEMQDLLQRHVDRIALVLAHDIHEHRNLFNVLSYSIREVFRNVFEHAETEELFYCAQYWPNSNKVEFAVSDFGIGVRQGLGTNPNFRFKTDKEALEFAMLPGVSGKTHEPRLSSNWFNSGYGLYMTSRLARHGGNFLLSSGEIAIQLTSKTKTNFTTSIKGTLLRVNLNVGEIGDVENRLAEFREDGKEIASRIKGSGNRPPSAMSLLLRRDYR